MRQARQVSLDHDLPLFRVRDDPLAEGKQGTPLSLEDARRLVAGYVEHYNTIRLHSAIGYVTPADKLAGREPVIFAERDRKLDEARARRKVAREAARVAVA